MIILANIVQSFAYAAPAAVVTVYVLVRRSIALRQMKHASKTPTSRVAEETLVKFLCANKIDDVSVAQGIDCFKNEYEPENCRIALSPDAYGRVDACSIAYALEAGAQTLTFRNSPEKLVRHNRLRLSATWMFWVVFCVLAFSIMGASLAGTCVGYALLVPTLILFALRDRLLKESRNVVDDYVRRSETFNPEEIPRVLKALNAVRLNP